MAAMVNEVVLLHGLGRTEASMTLMARRLGRAGFRVRCIGYPGTRGPIAASEAFIRRALGPGPADLVGHSLGGIIAARILREPQGARIGRVVQLGAPNLGSPLVERMGGLWPVRRLCGPAVNDLKALTAPRPTDRRIGAIAGTLGLPLMGLSGPNDGGVSVRSAWAGAGHRAAVPVFHTALPISSKATRLTARFLTYGSFDEGPL